MNYEIVIIYADGSWHGSQVKSYNEHTLIQMSDKDKDILSVDVFNTKGECIFETDKVK